MHQTSKQAGISMTKVLEKKWVFISALVHAVVLLGLGAASGPPGNPGPAGMVVNLVSFAPGDQTGAEGSFFKPVAVQAEATVKGRDIQRSATSFRQDSTAGHKITKLPGKDYQAGVTGTTEPLPEKKETTKVHAITEEAGWEQEPDTWTPPGQDTAGMLQTGSGEGPDLPDPAMSMDHPVPQLQSADVQNQPPLLAFTGHSSALMGILSGVEGGGPAKPELISLPEASYPLISRRLGEEGRVVLEVSVGVRGEVVSARVIESSSHERLDQAAMRAVKGAVFEPLRKYGMSGVSKRTVAYRFRLEEQ
jgi:TonB family protein